MQLLSPHGSAERLWFPAGREIRREHGKRRRDDKIIVTAGRLQPDPAARARLENELTQLSAQKLAPGRLRGDGQVSNAHGGAEPLDQPGLADDKPVAGR